MNPELRTRIGAWRENCHRKTERFFAEHPDDPMIKLLRDAPIDDEPLTPNEERAIFLSTIDMLRQEGVITAEEARYLKKRGRLD
jgi:hypothetical protein